MNIPALTLLRDHLAQLPDERVAMTRWLTNTSHSSELLHNCNTAGCIAGWTCALLSTKTCGWNEVSMVAAHILSMDYDVANTLFVANAHACTRLQAVARLDFLITHPDATVQDLLNFIEENEVIG